MEAASSSYWVTVYGPSYISSATIPIGEQHHMHFSVGKRVEGGVRNIAYDSHNVIQCKSTNLFQGRLIYFDEALSLGLPTDIIPDLTEQEVEIISARFCPMRKETYDMEQAQLAEFNARMALFEQLLQQRIEEGRQRAEEERQREEAWEDMLERRIEEAISQLRMEDGGQSVEEPHDDNFSGSETVTTSRISIVSLQTRFTEEQLRDHYLQALIEEDQEDQEDQEVTRTVDSDIEFPLEFEDVNECPVCREEDYVLPNYLLRLPCCHTICKSCLKHVSSCPQCRKTIDFSLVKRKK